MKIIKYLVVVLLFSSCSNISAGSLGGWNTIVFPVSNQQLDHAIDNLFKEHPEYVLPKKWENYRSDWIERRYVSLKTIFFYFKDTPEELYFVTFVDPGSFTENSKYARIAIRAVGISGKSWKKNNELSNKEKTRIEIRFKNEIVSKLEKITGTKSYIEK